MALALKTPLEQEYSLEKPKCPPAHMDCRADSLSVQDRCGVLNQHPD